MDSQQAKHLHTHLVTTIKALDEKYYAGQETGVADDTYNLFFNQLRTLERLFPEFVTPDSPTQRVGTTRDGVLAKVKHTQLMASLYTEVDHTLQGASDFIDRVKKRMAEIKVTHPGYHDLVMTVEPKYDGLAIRLRYKNRILVQAVTRGDGLIGEDVTHNAVMITNIPLVLEDNKDIAFTQDEDVEICGEVMIYRATLRTINEKMIAEGKKPFANTRNLAAGTMRQLDPSVAKERDLVFYPYDIIAKSVSEDHFINMCDLAKLGFAETIYETTTATAAALYKGHQHYLAAREVMPYDIDGVVYKINNLKLRELFGYTAREPRWAMAHKYAPTTALTKVLDITVQIGRTGKVTPVARIEPTFVGGVTVTNATLHNLHQVRKKGVHVGDEVVIQRAGDVIPEVVMVTTSIPPWEEDNRVEWQMPTTCPLCYARITLSKDLKQARCEGGTGCPGQIQERIAHFVSRRAMNIIGIADKTIEELLDKNFIRDVAGLMEMTLEDWSKFDPNMGKNVSNMLRAIHNGKTTTLPRFLFSLGILTVGEETAKELADALGTLEAIRTATMDLLLSIKGIGPETARNVVSYFANPSNNELVDRLIATGIKWPEHQKNIGALTGQTFVVTGSFEIRDREGVEQWIKDNGGKVSGSVSKKTSYLVAGSGGGEKRGKAEGLGVKVLNETELYDLVKEDKS